jgi:hypothetical protein
MSGVRGRSGRKPKSVADRMLHNPAFRPPANVVPIATAPTLPDQGSVEGWTPSRHDLAGLGRAGKTFLSKWVQVHVLNLQEGVIALSAARCLDDSRFWRRRSKRKGPDQARCAQLALGFERQFAQLLARLKVTP